MKKIVGCMIATTIIAGMFGSTVSASAVPVKGQEQIQRKQALVQKANRSYTPSWDFDVREQNTNEAEDIIIKITMGELSADDMQETLNSLGFFELEGETKTENVAATRAMSPPTPMDINLNAPLVYYNSNNREWLVSGGGSWKDEKLGRDGKAQMIISEDLMQ